MNRRDAFRSIAATGASLFAVDATGNITPPEEAKAGYLLVVRPTQPLTKEVVGRIREQLSSAVVNAETGCRKVIVVPAGLEICTIKADGTVCLPDERD